MFFHFSQNNSGGSFVYDDYVCHHVIIEADNYQEANDRAENIGIYFGGYGDCPCCGDRWYSQYSDTDGTACPSIYDIPVEEYKDQFGEKNLAYARVYLKDGTRLEYFEQKAKLPSKRKLAITKN